VGVGVVGVDPDDEPSPEVVEPVLPVEGDTKDEVELFPAAVPQPVIPKLARKSAPSVQGMLRKKRKT